MHGTINTDDERGKALLTADRKQIGQFVDALFRHADAGSFVALRSFQADNRPFNHTAHELNGDHTAFIQAAATAATLAAQAPKPVVFCPPIATFRNAKKADELRLANGLALSVECDEQPEAARATLEAKIGPATVVVQSGGEWADPATGELQFKLHLHWRLDRPTRTMEGHAKLKYARVLATKLVVADASNKPVVHPIRWPGSWHRKGLPRLAQIVSLTESEISLDAVLTLLEPDKPPPGPEPGDGDETTPGEDRTTAELIREIMTGGDYHAPITALAMRYLKGGMADAQAILTLRGVMNAVPKDLRDMKGKTKEPGRWRARYGDIPRAVRTAREKLDQDSDGSPGQIKGKRPSNLLNAMKLLRHDPALAGMLAFDQMQSRVVLRHPVPAFGKPAASGDWTARPIEDNDVTAMQEYMQAAGLASLSWEVLNRGMHRRAAENAFHPVRDYLDGLQWDGVPRLDSWLSVYLGAEDKPYTRAMGRMFLIQMVARVFRPGCKADYMLVLEGPQGVEKSKVCSILGAQWYGDHMPPLHGHGDDVRVSQYLRGKWVIEAAELNAFKSADVKHLKAFLSRQTEDYIPKYGRNNAVEPRQFVPIGTTNPEGGNTPLKDSTGARRFWFVAVGSIDLEGLPRDRDQLFAEAVYAFAKDEQWWPDPDFEREHFAPEQEARTEVSEWLEEIGDYLKRETAGLSVSLLEIGVEVMRIPRDRLATALTPAIKAEIGACLRKLGWVRKRHAKSNRWEPGPDWRADEDK